MKKKLFAVIGIITITVAMLAGCSSKDVEADAQASTEPTSQAVTVSDTTKPAESTTVPESTTAETTTEKETAKTTTKAAVKTTTKAAPKTTTAKQTTKSTTAATTKATTQATTKATTKATTTVKNVSAKDVQAQVNSYIRSKGITVDSSLNPSNSGWNVPISSSQNNLNNGRTLSDCKWDVDSNVNNMGNNISMYCYLDGQDFYICYM